MRFTENLLALLWKEHKQAKFASGRPKPRKPLTTIRAGGKLQKNCIITWCPDAPRPVGTSETKMTTASDYTAFRQSIAVLRTLTIIWFALIVAGITLSSHNMPEAVELALAVAMLLIPLASSMFAFRFVITQRQHRFQHPDAFYLTLLVACLPLAGGLFFGLMPLFVAH
jgi:hypothetical protein